MLTSLLASSNKPGDGRAMRCNAQEEIQKKRCARRMHKKDAQEYNTVQSSTAQHDCNEGEDLVRVFQADPAWGEGMGNFK